MTEKELATLCAQSGLHVLEHLGRYWQVPDSPLGPCIYVPIHRMARLTLEEADFPAPWCLLYRARISYEFRDQNNGFMRLHLLPFRKLCGSYWENLPSEIRRRIRRAGERFQVCQLNDPSLLEKDGYDILLSVFDRTHYAKPPSKKEYIKSLEKKIFLGGKRLVLGVTTQEGFFGKRLVAYLTGSSVESTAYFNEVNVSSDVLRDDVGSLLVYSFVHACENTAGISEVVYGPEAWDKPSLTRYKTSVGFPIAPIPVKIGVRFGCARLAQSWLKRRPEQYHRLYGVLPGG